MTRVAGAEDVVRAARSRLVAARILDGAARGTAAGAAAALAVALVLVFVGRPWVPLLALPVAGAVAGLILAAGRRPSLDAAALALDRAAATDEAFVSALTATDAPDWVREATAERAVRVCCRADVPRVLPFAVPAAAAVAAAATGLLAAMVLVPAAEPAIPRLGGAPSAIGVSAPAGGAGPATPQDRVRAMADAVREGVPPSGVSRETVRSDLAAVRDDEIRALAEALAAGGSEAARRALDALARGDREAATDALRAALGARDAGARAAAGGGENGGSTGPDVPSRPRSSGGGAWPLGYDRAIRTYFEEQR